MFVVILRYTVPLETIDALVPGHVDFLKQQYDAGLFLASGRQVPRTGGVILAQAPDRDMLMRVLAEDPFHKAGVAEYEVIEFVPSMTAPALAAFMA